MTGLLVLLAALAGLLNRALGIFAAKASQTDMSELAIGVWEGYAPSWTPAMVGLGLIVMLAAIIVAVISVHRGRITGGRAFFGVLLVFYLYLMYGSTVFTRTPGTTTAAPQTDLFWSYREMLARHSWSYAKEIGLNILMFVPIGILYPLWRGKRCFFSSMAVGFLCTCAIELMQYYFKCGLFEVDDIFNNTLGMFVGYMFIRWFLPKHAARRRRSRRKD